MEILRLCWRFGHKLEETLSKVAGIGTLETRPYSEQCFLNYQDETRLLGLSNHINYKTIESEMREL